MRLFDCLSLSKLCGNGSQTITQQTKVSEAGFSYDPTRSNKEYFDDPTHRFGKTHSEDPTQSDKTHFNDRTPSDKVHFDNPTSSGKAHFNDPNLEDPTRSDKPHVDGATPSDKAHVGGATPSDKPHVDGPTPSDKPHSDDRTRMTGPLKLPLKEIKLVTNNFDVDNFIGKGVLGKIYEGQLPLERGVIDVSVRRLDHSFWLQELAFEKEISVLSRLKHENMVSMVGYCYENNEMLIINERVVRGSLTFCLSDRELTWMRRLQIGVGVVRALSHLHSNSIIHHNINSDSILLDENWQAKISGFEFSMTTAGGNLDVAYEKLGMGTYKSDVFSVGIVLFELLCGKKAFVSEDDNSFQASLAIFHYENRTLNNLVDPDLFKQMDQLSFNIFSETAYYCLNKHGAVLNMNQVRKRLERALDVQQMHDKNEQSTVPFERTRPEHLKSKLKNLEHMRIRLADIMAATNNFRKGFVAGGFGSVYTAELEHVHKEYCIEIELENEHEVPKKRSIVAIKRITDTENLIAEQGFYAEIEMLTSCKHPNIITLLGFCDESRAMILIYEYASNGSLNYHLQKMSTNPNDSWAQRVKICIGAANGISCLHATQGDRQEIVHRDIKSANILLDENFEAKIGDFGLSIFPSVSEENYNVQYSRKVLGTPVYMDPQYSKDGKLKIKSDVYSFGVVLLEILSGTVVYDRKYAEENNKGLVSVARQHFKKGTIMEMVDPRLNEETTETHSVSNRGPNQDSLNKFSKIAFDCLAGAQAKRPTMEDVVRELKKALFFQAGPLERLKISLKDIRIATKNFTLELLGAGAYGNAYHAELELTDIEKATGEISKKWTDVAIKCITKSHGKEGFNAEIEFISSCKHTNLVSLRGYCDEGPDMILVYEHATSKSLDNYLGGNGSSTNLTWVQCIKIGIDIARALDYLHTRKVDDEQRRVHGDIKSSNILLSKNLVAKIANIGLSRFHRANQQEKTLHTKNIAGTNLYLCPEDNENRLTTAVDIYSFGVVLFEILSGKLASDQTFLAEDVKGIAQVARVRFKEQKLNKMVDPKIMDEVNELKSALHKGPNQDSLRTFLDIAYKCIAEDQNGRPTAKDILNELNKALSYQENNKDSLQIPLEEIKLATNNFSQENFIGGGGFGNVYKGEVANGNETAAIVAKRLDRMRGQGEEQFLMELEILFDYKHDKIISLEGYCNENGEKIIVCEYASKGSLDSHLNNVSLTWTKRLRICIDIAHGLAFLHNCTDPTQEMVMHRDIKSANILLNAEWKAKISDFGLSVITSTNQEEVYNVVGTIGYVDPQYVHTGIFTEKSDIYSLGVVLFEILHGSVLYRRDYNQTHTTGILEHIHEEEKLGSIVFEGIKGKIDPKSLSTFRLIVSQCLDTDRDRRPTAEEVLQQLEISLEFQEDYENWGSKLPEDYEELLKLSACSEAYHSKMKKDLYNLFSEGILLQDDKLLFTLGENGERKEMISARTFSFRNGSPHDNWCINVPKSRFKMVAEMLDISNLMIKIKTKAQFLSPNTEYGVYLVFKFCDSRNVSKTPIYVDLKYRKGNDTLHAYFAKWRDDEWMMIELYRFLNHKDDGDFEVLLESLSAYYCREHDAIYVESVVFQPINNVEHEETENSREIHQVLESNSNLDQALQIPTKSEMILKGSINYDYGEELFSLTEVNGKKHLMLSAKAALYNSSDLELFVPKPTPKSRFEEALELLPQQIFRISCTLKSQMLSRDADYVCYLVFKLSEKCNEMQGPVEVRDLLQKNKVPEFVYFRTPSPWNIHNITQVPKQRRDGWMEVKVEKFKTNRELENDCVRVNLKFVSYEGTLSGLIVCGLEFRPM